MDSCAVESLFRGLCAQHVVLVTAAAPGTVGDALQHAMSSAEVSFAMLPDKMTDAWNALNCGM